jgi:hypothetical protein
MDPTHRFGFTGTTEKICVSIRSVADILKRAPFTRNNNGLTLSLFPHSRIRVLRNSKQMWFKIASLSTGVCLNDIGAIHSDALKRVDSNEHNTAVCIYTVLCISIANGMEDCTD